MRLIRLVASVVLIAGLAIGDAASSSTTSSDLVGARCDTSALSVAFGGPEPLQSIQNFGCRDGWAFVWATIGTGSHAIGVTEVLRVNHDSQQWEFASRLLVCKPSTLPALIYRRGCFSN